MRSIISNYYLGIIPNFYIEGFECDLFTLNKNLYTTEYEIKCSMSDYNNDFKKKRKYFNWGDQKHTSKNKHEIIKNGGRTNRLYFVVEENIDVDIPDYSGLITFKKHERWTSFGTKKGAPLIHKNKADQKLIIHCLSVLKWRYYNELV